MGKRKRALSASLKRGKPSREQNKRILIVCEDSKSSPSYFDRLRQHHKMSSKNVVITPNNNKSAPLNIVALAKNKIREDEFDIVYCVFDRDTHSTYDAALQNISKLKKIGIKIFAITSNPCFELWYLLHFGCSTRGLNSQELISELKKHAEFKNYKKGNKKCCFFNKILDKIESATENSKLLSRNTNIDVDKHHRNPCTYVHELVTAFKTNFESVT